MSDITHFFAPINFEEVNEKQTLDETQFGSIFTIYKTDSDFPDLEGAEIAIIGVCEDRNAPNNDGCRLAPDTVRSYLYKLFGGSFTARVADLGNIKAGHSVEDTYFAVKDCVDFLIRKS